MSNDSRPRGHPLKWWQVLSLIGAGGLSFLGSAYWSMSAGSVPEEEVGQDGRALAMNQVEDRARNTSAPAISSKPKVAALQRTPPVHPEERDLPPWNPFGPLGAGAPLPAAVPSPRSTSTPTAAGPVVASPLALVSRLGASSPATRGSTPLPFDILGGISGDGIGEGRPIVFLRMGNEVLLAQAGDVIDGYRVEVISKDRIELSSLALGVRHVLPLRP
jgi:hypothetical protein